MKFLIFIIFIGSPSVWASNDLASKIDLKGDLRYRHEAIDEETKTPRQRQRIRARLELSGQVNPQTEVGLRLASGGENPLSTNQTLGDDEGGFLSRDLKLDRAFFDWHPTGYFHIAGGKIKNPHDRGTFSEVVWDGDVNPEGISVGLKGTGLFATASHFWLQERKDGEDAKLNVLELGGQALSGLQAGVGYLQFTNLKGFRPIVDTTDNAGNTLDGSSNYAFKYELLEAFFDWQLTLGSLKCELFGQYVINQDPEEDNEAYLVGLSLIPHPKWGIEYNFRELQKDATLGALTDSDFVGGGTDGRGHEAKIGYKMAENTKIQLTHNINKVGLDNSRDYNRTQVDFKFKF